MPARVHDDETDAGEAVVRVLLERQCPHLVVDSITEMSASGTDNVTWRVTTAEDRALAVRLPRSDAAAHKIVPESDVLMAIARQPLRALVRTPDVVHVGTPDDGFPHPWSVLEWLDGTDAWASRGVIDGHATEIARALSEVVGEIGRLDLAVPARQNGDRGGPIEGTLRRIERWVQIDGASDLVDVRAIRRLCDEAAETAEESARLGVVHGDLISGNVLIDGGRLAAIIDWGGIGRGDLAQDLAPAWSILPRRARQVFRSLRDVDDAMWIRARTMELEHAVGGVLYYRPRHHVLGDIMAATLERILDDATSPI